MPGAVPRAETAMPAKRPPSSTYSRREAARARLRRLDLERAELLRLFPDLVAGGGRRRPPSARTLRRSREVTCAPLSSVVNLTARRSGIIGMSRLAARAVI